MMLLLRTSTENRSGTSDSSSGALGSCGPSVWPIWDGIKERSIVTRFVASPLMTRNTLICARSPGESSCLMKASISGIASRGPVTISVLLRGFGVIIDFVEHAGLQDLLALLVHRQEFEHGGATALPGLRGGDHLLQSVRDVDRQRIVDADDLGPIDRTRSARRPAPPPGV